MIAHRLRTTLAILVVLGLVVACDSGVPSPGATELATSGSETAAPSEPAMTAEPSSAPTAAPATEAPATEAPATEAPATAEPTGPSSPGPSESIAPSVDSLTVKRTADCNADNGTGSVGFVRITWTASGTTGVRISIDPPSADVAYGYGYADYPASGSADVPFACGAPNHDSHGDYHFYVVTTIHDKGYYFWRSAKVYQATP